MSNQIQDVKVVRFPLVDTEHPRSFSGAASSSEGGIVGFGIVGIMIVGAILESDKDQHFLNCIPEQINNPLTNEILYCITKRPGFAINSTPAGSAIGSAIHIWSGKSPGTAIITTFGATNSTVYEGTTSRGTTTGKVLFINDTLVGTTPNLTFVTDGNKAYYYPNAGVLTQITDVDFPGEAGETITGNFVFLDGYTFIMTVSGKIYNSDLNSLSSWSSLGFISSNMSSDTGIGLTRYKDQIVAFGKESVEFFSDVGNPTGSPLGRTPQGFINIGAVSQHTIVQLDDTVAFMGSTSSSGIALYVLNGLSAKRVSTPAIEAIFAISDTSNFYLNVFKLSGKTYISLVTLSEARTYLYNLENDVWHEWTGPSIVWQYITGIAAGNKYVYAVTSQDISGNIYVIDPTNFVFQDNGENYTMLIQTSRRDLGISTRKFNSKLRVVGDIQRNSTICQVSWSDDDYNTWSNSRTFDMANIDPYTLACGSFRRRAFSISYTGDGPARFESLELELKQGIH